MRRRQKLRPTNWRCTWRCWPSPAPPMALHSVDTSGVFDPYETLRVSDSPFSLQIKKAFRALDRQLHPDINLHNLRAAAQFMRARKAYEALPDTHCADNYRNIGHPDGP
ncbi:hypothetical protein PF005_g30600 [Phytophthora fragariae]|uniref:J domain-containing protein n=1 Tax=Phytophthora fragariae TaxID=53985 RepID=A0A6A3VH73_9STRA|nr:hypothetical protein PF003_g13332 [Phytophthora fragariae]KAE8918872.1 hypothetical protein PF009_g30816 [Phytophthora fragariae]KAE9060331.1 hypothetical protein PF010_g30264 [Phytophthora fragariae]KAE9062934.1 hypothetical protein PF007_g29734 [Phytophthora fragariae]KAE9163057.1 hypothetical protein PF005_g30600 [Phytophthora fragariae]